MAKQKILSMPLRVAPNETFELVAFVVNVEFDSAGYEPYDVKPGDIGYKIFDPSGAIIVSGTFSTKLVAGLYMTHHAISLTTPGTYGVYLEDTVEKCYGFTQIHVSTVDKKIDLNIDAQITTRASQTTVDAIKNQTDNLRFDGSRNVLANVQDKGVLNDVSASEIDNQLSSSHGSGSWEGADTSGLAQESTVQAIKSQTDKMQFDASNNILSIAQNSELSNLDATVSSRASQSSVNAIKSQTDKLQFDSNDYVKANVQDKGVLNDPSVTDIDNQLSSTHGSGSWEGGGGSCDPSAIADAVWDEAVADHVSSGTFGRYISEIYGKVVTILTKLKNLW